MRYFLPGLRNERGQSPERGRLARRLFFCASVVKHQPFALRAAAIMACTFASGLNASISQPGMTTAAVCGSVASINTDEHG